MGRLKALIKALLRNANRFYIQRFQTFDVPSLSTALSKLGVESGDVLIVHSSYNDFKGFAGQPTDVLRVLEDLVGPTGTILMPSFPFSGTALAYVTTGAITDISRTPSRVGLLTEVFRRQSGTLRSIHPTHPVLARGAQAGVMTDGHEHAQSPCGAGTPFARLLEADGKMLFLGASIESMTFFHYLEEKFERRMRVSPFTSETYPVQVRSRGALLTVQTRLFDPELSRRRRIGELLPELRRANTLKSTKIGGLSVLLIKVADVQTAFEAVLQKGKSFYV